jgi:hypothetical protein
MNVDFLPRALRGYAHDALSAFRQTPIEVALGVATAIGFSIGMRQEEAERWFGLLLGAALAMPLVLAVSVLWARGRLSGATRWGVSTAVLLAAAAYGLWVFDPQLESEGWRFAALFGAVVMAVSLVPTLGVRDEEVRRTTFWRFNARLLTRIVTVVAYAGALFAALAGAVSAVTALFDLNTPERLFGDLMGAVFFGLVPWVVAGGLAELVEGLESEEARPPRPIHLLGSYLYAPVLTVYLVILLAYAAKVLGTGEAPKNLLSPIILLAGAFGFLGSTLLEPLRRSPEHGGVSRLIRFLPVPLLVLLPFALWAVWVRRDQYGWTEFRYLRFALLLAIAALAASGAIRLLRRREPVLLLVPLVLGATLLLSSFGPWGMTAVSRRNQQERLRDGLESAGLLEGGRVTLQLAPPNVAAPPMLSVPADVYERISGSLAYLYDQHGPGAVQGLFAADVSGYERGQALVSAFRFRAECRTDQAVLYASATLPSETPVPGLPGGTLYRVEGTRRSTPREGAALRDDEGEVVPVRRTGGPPRVRFVGDAIDVSLPGSADGWTARVDLGPLVDRLNGGVGEGCAVEGSRMSVTLTPEEARLPLVDAAGVSRGVLVLTSINAVDPGDDGLPGAPLSLDRIEGLVVVGGR